MKKPVYQTNHIEMTLDYFRKMFHGISKDASIVFQLDGKRFVPVQVIQEQQTRVVVVLEGEKF